MLAVRCASCILITPSDFLKKRNVLLYTQPTDNYGETESKNLLSHPSSFCPFCVTQCLPFCYCILSLHTPSPFLVFSSSPTVYLCSFGLDQAIKLGEKHLRPIALGMRANIWANSTMRLYGQEAPMSSRSSSTLMSRFSPVGQHDLSPFMG